MNVDENRAIPTHGEPILLVTTTFAGTKPGGRELLTALHRDALHELLGPKLVIYQIRRESPTHSDADKLFDGLRGYVDGVNSRTLTEIAELILSHGVRRVFLDGSNLGGVAMHLRRESPAIEVYTFCHNVEARFFWGAFCSSPSFRTLAVTLVNYVAEHHAVRYSHTLICINERDSRLMRCLHGRSADAISYMALRDAYANATLCSDPRLNERYILFVGGSFYANRTGIEWFARNVSPRLPIPTYVVGRGFDDLREELERHPNVIVIGEVDDLAHWYAAASAVVAPIFDGSGMKTKVAEALMHGRRVIGTREAFVGYESIPARLRVSCGSPEEFIAAINEALQAPPHADAAQLRQLYVEHHSMDAAKRRLARILQLGLQPNAS